MNKKFRTSLDNISSDHRISHEDNIFLVGSCFVEHITAKFNKHKFANLSNPFGILYNAMSIVKCLDFISNNEALNDKDLIQHNELWHSYWHHGKFSHPDKNVVLKKCNKELDKARMHMAKSSVLILTLGTAFVYKLLTTNEVVGNCHKLPASNFEKSRMNVKDVVRYLEKAIKALRITNLNLKIVLTVSPVRHLKDGFIENQRSKSVLLLACEKLSDSLHNVQYFPSYEIMMDDLRDYRFYKDDFLHPNNLAIEYIWNKFSKTYFSQHTLALNQKIQDINKSLEHRPLHPNTEKHQTFLKRLNEKIMLFEKEHPNLKFD